MAASWPRFLRRSHLGTEADRATFRTLHTASLASPALRDRADADQCRAQRQAPPRPARGAGGRAHRHRRRCSPGTAPATTTPPRSPALAGGVAEQGNTRVATGRELSCGEPGCQLRHAIVSPLVVEDQVVGTLQVFTSYATAGLIRAADEVAQWVSGQLALAELDASRARLMEAEVRALRAQISPHFIYNSLGAIA